MSMKGEIVRALFLVFGAVQILTNIIYLARRNGMDWARKQHRELPKAASDAQMRCKATAMLVIGIIFFATGLTAFLTRSYHELGFIIALGAMVAYELAEAFYYRYWRTWGALCLSVVLLGLVALL